MLSNWNIVSSLIIQKYFWADARMYVRTFLDEMLKVESFSLFIEILQNTFSVFPLTIGRSSWASRTSMTSWFLYRTYGKFYGRHVTIWYHEKRSRWNAETRFNNHMNTHTYIHTYIHTYTHTYIHTYVHTYIYTYIHTYTHTHIHSKCTCMRIYLPWTPSRSIIWLSVVSLLSTEIVRKRSDAVLSMPIQ